MKSIRELLLLTAFLGLVLCANAWGKEGHSIVAAIAYDYLDQATKDSVDKYLNGQSIEDASNWMDQIRSDHTYDFMKPWHYINIEKGETYTHSYTENIINELNEMLRSLRDRKNESKEEASAELRILIHLIGDLHQPLHVGYGIDRGGNTIQVSFLDNSSNLHQVWDTEIIQEAGITKETCLKLLRSHPEYGIDSVHSTDIVGWMNDSRECLTSVYGFTNSKIDQKYIEDNVPVIEKELLKAGARLAYVLQQIFKR